MVAEKQVPDAITGTIWTIEENDAIVADYFGMLMQDLSGETYNKAEHNRNLQEKIGRTRGSIEYKHQNISAVLLALGEAWIPGYKPAGNFQLSLIDAIQRWFKNNPNYWKTSVTSDHLTYKPSSLLTLQIEPPPAPGLSPPTQFDQIWAPIAHKFDIEERHKRNRILGRAGEKCVLHHEKIRLENIGRSDLARKVRWISEEEGDGAGYDIESYSPTGDIRLIEVKTTNGWERTPFHISRNELAVSEDRPAEWRLLRLWNFARNPRAFKLDPPLDAHVNLCATSYQANFL